MFKGIIIQIDNRDVFIPFEELKFDYFDYDHGNVFNLIYFKYNCKDYVIEDGYLRLSGE